MPTWIADAAFSSALVNVALLASWDVLPALLVAYMLQSFLARRVRPEFSLRKSETAELDRALLLYRGVCSRLKAIDESTPQPNRSWSTFFALTPKVDPQDADEREDLEAHAHHLRAMIVQLRRLPLERLRGFVRAMSLRFALGRAVAVQIAAFTLFFLVFRVSEHPASAHESMAGAQNALVALVWFPLDQSLFQANAMGACLAALSVPMLYFLRCAAFRHELGLEFCVLKELAAATPDQEVDQIDADTYRSASAASGHPAHGADEWFTILGVSPSATIEQVREAYRALMKQSHPDLVQGLSPAIRRFAEAETKRINAAYREAVAALGRGWRITDGQSSSQL
jgi:DnaJ-domain-containing protein 1